MKNGIVRGIIPAILLTLPVGSVYAFSIFSPTMAELCHVSLTAMQVAFSLSIFFLGMGAAFFGPIVEKNPGKAGALATLLYLFGFSGTSYGLGVGNYWIVLLSYGVLNGLGQGIAYLSPVKTLMLWFPKHKGLAASVSIVSFGLGSTLCSFLYGIFKEMPLPKFFALLSLIYLISMTFGSILILKPKVKETVNKVLKFSYKSLFKDRMFWHSWIFMYLNITAGLALIGCSASIFKDATFTANTIIILMMLAGIFNGTFRLIFAWSSDYIKPRIYVWYLLGGLSILFMLASGCWYYLIGFTILLINACYGGGFSTCPAVLSDYYPNDRLSRIHGAVLSAWAMAGLTGNLLAQFIYNSTGSFKVLIWVLLGIYCVNMFNIYLGSKVFKLNKRGG
jgi:OFA family oxalate/formate antiporter-like MFS transporter